MQLLASVLSTTVLLLCLEGIADSGRVAKDDSWAHALVSAANAWRAGEPIPVELRRYQESPGDMPVPTDTNSMIGEITNVPLLAALASDPLADPRSRELAYLQGMYVGGPTKFFAVLGPHLDAGKEANNPWLVELQQRVAQRHVVVNALFIEDADMPREK